MFQITSDSTVAVPGQTTMSTVAILDDDRKLRLNNECKTVDVSVAKHASMVITA